MNMMSKFRQGVSWNPSSHKAPMRWITISVNVSGLTLISLKFPPASSLFRQTILYVWLTVFKKLDCLPNRKSVFNSVPGARTQQSKTKLQEQWIQNKPSKPASVVLMQVHICTCIKTTLAGFDGLFWIHCSCSFVLLCCVRAPGTELNTDFRFGKQSSFLNTVNQTYNIVCRNSDEAGGNFNDIKANPLTFTDIVIHRMGALWDDGFHETPCRNFDIIFMGYIKNLLQFFFWIKCESTTGEVQDIYIFTHCFQNITQITFSHHTVIGPPDFSNPHMTWFVLAS